MGDIDTKAMRERAEKWTNIPGCPAVTRDTAINEEHLALDVLELLDLVENTTCARHADQKHGAEAELFFVRYQLLGRTHLAGPDHWNALHSQYVEILNLDGATNVEIVEAAEVMPAAYLKARDEKLAAVERERDEYHGMLRSILALCDDSTRASLGPDAPLRAVRKAVTERDEAFAKIESLYEHMEATHPNHKLVAKHNEIVDGLNAEIERLTAVCAAHNDESIAQDAAWCAEREQLTNERDEARATAEDFNNQRVAIARMHEVATQRAVDLKARVEHVVQERDTARTLLDAVTKAHDELAARLNTPHTADFIHAMGGVRVGSSVRTTFSVQGRCAMPDRIDIPRVVNIHRDADVIRQAKATGRYVYIGRGKDSIWGNPYTHIAKGTLAKFVVPYDEVLKRYEQHVRASEVLMNRLGTLRSKVLGCFCKPRPCHGDVLVKLVEELFANGDIK